MGIKESKNYRRLRKLVTNPNLVFYNYFSRRIGIEPLTGGDAGDTPAPRLFEAIQTGANPWQLLAERFDLYSGAVTGRPDQSLLINADRLRWLVAALFELADFNGIDATVYTLGGGTVHHIAGSRRSRSSAAPHSVYADLATRPDFVIELRGSSLHTVAAHVFPYDLKNDGIATVRSTRAWVKRFRHSALADVYPRPLFDAAGGLVATAPQAIDAVFTWVDKRDPGWQDKWNREFPTTTLDADRFTSNDELLYAVRSIAKYAPWFRRVYVVTNCARPEYFPPDSPVTWVDHEAVFPDPAVLPVFNSHAIESCLHRITDLSEHFVYFNDDMLLNQPCYASDFFDPWGRSIANLETYGMVMPKAFGPKPPDYLVAARNSQALLNTIKAGAQARQLHQHTPYALRKSVLIEMEERFPKAFAKTRAAKLRSATDVNVASFLHAHYALAQGKAVVAEPKAVIVRPRNIDSVLASKNQYTWKFLCFNDGENSSSDQAFKTATQRYMTRRFEEVSRYELPADGTVATRAGAVVRANGSSAGSSESAAGRTVLTYGTFDLFHEGHVRLLQRARAYGDRLIVALSTDEFNALKGKKAVMSYEQRKLVLEACKYVDQVIPEQTWEQKSVDVRVHAVDVMVMGDDWTGKFDFLKPQCEVVYLPRTEDVSTTQIKHTVSTHHKPAALEGAADASASSTPPAPSTAPLRFSGPPSVNVVLLAASENLRPLEEEFADGIRQALPDFEHARKVKSTAPNAVNVTFWIHRPGQVMMSHGVADKNYLTRRKAGVRLINKYERVLVPGDWLKRKLLATKGVELDAAAIDIVGWPRLDRLLEAQRQHPLPPREGRKLRLLWAPTHSALAGTSSYPALEAHADALADLFDYRVSQHPNDRQGGTPTFDALLEADVVVADQGTMLYEAWALGKTVVCPAWLVKDGIEATLRGSAEALIYDQRLGLHAGSFDEMIDMVRDGGPPDARVRSFLDDYLAPSAIGHAYERIADSIRKVWQAHAQA